jgi:uncharacterized protein (TIGR01777 family)
VKVAISGASGLLGSALVPALRAEGHDVIRLVRREVTAGDEVSWDPAAGELDVAALEGVDAFVNLSGANLGKRWTAARKREIVASRVDTTALLARAAAELEPRPKVFLSAGGSGIYGDRGNEILTEESALGSGFLADVGKSWVTAADPAREAGVRVVTFRQGVVLTREGGALARMLTPFRLGVAGRIGSGKQWLSWVTRDDLVSAYSFVLESELSGAVNLCAPNPVTNEQFAKALGRAVNRPTIIPTPAFVIRTLYGEMGEAVLLEGQRMLPARLLEAGFEFSAPTIGVGLTRALS